MKPLLKWAGGKRQLANVISDNLPSDWNSGTYFEPFIGGAAMYLHLEPNKAIIADINPRLINFYLTVRDHNVLLIEQIEKISNVFAKLQNSETKKRYYLRLRLEFNSRQASTVRDAALFYSLNKLCFNGLFRENSKGLFNVPFGNKKDFPELDKPHFEKVSSVLHSTKILTSDYASVVAEAKSGDFVYFDPPYIPVDATSNFTAYTSAGFDLQNQRRLADTMSSLKQKGVRALLSNSDTPISREIYKDFKMLSIQAPRMVSAKSSGRGRISELLIKNY